MLPVSMDESPGLASFFAVIERFEEAEGRKPVEVSIADLPGVLKLKKKLCDEQVLYLLFSSFLILFFFPLNLVYNLVYFSNDIVVTQWVSYSRCTPWKIGVRYTWIPSGLCHSWWNSWAGTMTTNMWNICIWNVWTTLYINVVALNLTGGH